jgi:hypothetical protein
MFGYRSGSVSTNVSSAETHRVLGVLWTPAESKHRWIPPKDLVPANRRSGGAHRRPRHSSQNAAVSDSRAVADWFITLAWQRPASLSLYAYS